MRLNRFITRLNVKRDSVERSFGTLAGRGPKAAVVPVQLPSRTTFDEERADGFFRLVAPRWAGTRSSRGTRSWFRDDALAFLRRRNVALVIGEPPRWPTHVSP